jgi:hypothetical protein
MLSSKTGMTYRIAGSARIAFVIFTATILTVGSCGDVAAGQSKRYMLAHGFVSQHIAKTVQPVSQQPVRPGLMRYYGGPKSLMWRGPAEN